VPNIVVELNFAVQLLTARCLSRDVKGLYSGLDLFNSVLSMVS